MYQCPLGLIPHFYALDALDITEMGIVCQCPLGLIPHFYGDFTEMVHACNFVSMPSRAYTSFLPDIQFGFIEAFRESVNALSGLYLISTREKEIKMKIYGEVSMPSRAYTSFLHGISYLVTPSGGNCVNALSGLYLISTKSNRVSLYWEKGVCQCPLGLIPHFYGTPSKT